MIKLLNSVNEDRLKNYIGKIFERYKYFIGYPIAQDCAELYHLLKLPLNNVGDPFIESTYDLNSRAIELEVLQFFPKFFNAPVNNWWGYITNGPVFMLYAIKKCGLEGILQRGLDCLELSVFAVGKLKTAGIGAWKNLLAITVVFPEPSLELRQKWQIATENGFSHIICMPGISRDKIESLLSIFRNQ